MKVSTIDNLLKHNPWFRDLSEDTKISIYNEVLEDIFTLYGQTYLNQTASAIDNPFITAFVYNLQSLGLSKISNIDNRLMDYQLISELDEQSRLAVYSMAVEEIAKWSELYESKDYQYSTVVPDNLVYEAKSLILRAGFSYKFLAITDQLQRMFPELSMEAVILNILENSKTIISEVQLLVTILSQFESAKLLTFPIKMEYGFSPYNALEQKLLSMGIELSYTFTPYNIILDNSLRIPIALNYSIPSESLLSRSTVKSPIALNYSVLSDADFADEKSLVFPISITYQIT